MNYNPEKYLIAHDLGTSGDKATLFGTDGTVVNSYTAAYPVHFFGANCAEQSPSDWWDAVCAATKKVLEGIDPARVAGISFSAQMQACLLVDADGIPLRPAIIWADQRAEAQAGILEEKIGGDEIYRITGHRLSAAYSIEKLMWLKEHEPECYSRAYKMLQVKDYIIFRLTGVFVTDCSDASGTNAFALDNRQWSERIIGAAGVRRELFPEVRESVHIAGGVTGAAAKQTGLAEGTPVVCGGGDGPCSAVGAGCVRDGELFTTFGTSAWIGGTTGRKFVDEDKTLFCFAHVIPGKYMPCGTMQAAGSAYSYIRKLFCGGSSYEETNDMIRRSPVGARGLIFLPYLLGERSPRWNPDSSGCYLGIRMRHQRGDYLRAAIEGVGMNLELILRAYRKKMEVPDMIFTGGGAKGDIVCEILSDIYGIPLRTPGNVEGATSVGAAVIAGVGTGIYRDFQVAKEFMKIERSYMPVPEHVKRYEEWKPVFDMAYERMLPVYEELRKAERSLDEA